MMTLELIVPRVSLANAKEALEDFIKSVKQNGISDERTRISSNRKE